MLFRSFTQFDFREWYHLIRLHPADVEFTAFQADNQLFEYLYLPSGIPNSAATFEFGMKKWINQAKLPNVFMIKDQLIVAGYSERNFKQSEDNLSKALRKAGITKEDKIRRSHVRTLNLMGYVVGDGQIKPDVHPLDPLTQMGPPRNAKDMKSILGIFEYYQKWIPDFEAKTLPLLRTDQYPISKEANEAFMGLKRNLQQITLTSIDDSAPLVIETDASNVAISATLNQHGKPYSFFSQKLTGPDLNLAAPEKETKAILETVIHWQIGRAHV